MQTSLENILFKKYPSLFPNGRKVNPQESLMCFGFECDDGWFDLIDVLCEHLLTIDEKKEIVVAQVKEKFGGLRFYPHAIPTDISSQAFICIRFAEEMSYRICEKCGNKGKLTKKKGWYKTLCRNCDKK